MSVPPCVCGCRHKRWLQLHDINEYSRLDSSRWSRVARLHVTVAVRTPYQNPADAGLQSRTLHLIHKQTQIAKSGPWNSSRTAFTTGTLLTIASYLPIASQQSRSGTEKEQGSLTAAHPYISGKICVLYRWCMTVSVRKRGCSFMPINLCVCLMSGVQLPGKAVKEGALLARHDAIPRSKGCRCKSQDKAAAVIRATCICAKDRRASPAKGAVVQESNLLHSIGVLYESSCCEARRGNDLH